MSDKYEEKKKEICLSCSPEGYEKDNVNCKTCNKLEALARADEKEKVVERIKGIIEKLPRYVALEGGEICLNEILIEKSKLLAEIDKESAK